MNIENYLPGITISLSRRRYGRQTYTWLSASRSDGKTLRAIDPWPCVTPRKAEIVAELKNESNWESK